MDSEQYRILTGYLQLFEKGLLHVMAQLERIESVESKISEVSDKLLQISEKSETIDLKVEQEVELAQHLQRKVNTILQRTAIYPQKIRVLFCVFYRRFWAPFDPIYKAMLESSDFDPIVVALNDCGRMQQSADDFEVLCEYLEQRGVRYIKWGRMDSNGFRCDQYLLENLSPDIVFKQTHWDDYEPRAVRTDIAAGYRICYISYGFDIADHPDVSVNQDLNLSAWRIFTPSNLHLDYFRTCSLIQAQNVVVTGHPRIDEIATVSAEKLEAKLGTYRPFQVLWAPHHSVGPEWLRYGTFHTTSQTILRFVKASPDVSFVLRQHHQLFEILVKLEIYTQQQIEEFLAEWDSMPNTTVDEDPSYVHSFAESDVLLTDGVSFLAEYQATLKPVIFVEREDHLPFTSFGEQVVESVYRFNDIEAALSKIVDLKNGGEDTLASSRKKLAEMMMPFPEGATERILHEIRKGLAEECRKTC